jgi:hypothetical protein
MVGIDQRGARRGDRLPRHVVELEDLLSVVVAIQHRLLCARRGDLGVPATSGGADSQSTEESTHDLYFTI